MSAPLAVGRRRGPALIAVLIAASVTASCVSAPPDVSTDDPELVQGRDVYARNCVSCHGSDGGGGVGRKLSQGAVVDAYPSIETQIELISNGKGSMPSYAERLSDEQIRAVARYTREAL